MEESMEEGKVINWWKKLDKDNIFFMGFIAGIMSVAIVFTLYYVI